ncbi:RNA polymerase sigma factor [Actinokineospora baliensis]|uniref:RNA polymerase sigma factor n=1 Tax=Actinokineospora baliensis TaxID=547056 RepID=UPI00195F1A9E|nr:RNA polymerase sigma factor [Actinokineospora baliensis]
MGRAPEGAEGFAEWVGPHVGVIARVVGRVGAGWGLGVSDRDDVVQEVLARAWVKRRQFDPGRGSPRVWLLAIAADQVRKFAGRRRREHLQPAGVVEAEPTAERVDLGRALLGLTERQRLAVDCFYYADLSIAETAVVMGCGEGTVKSTLSDARAKLRVRLEVSHD